MADYTLTANAGAYTLTGQVAALAVLAAEVTQLPLVIVTNPKPPANVSGTPLIVVTTPKPAGNVSGAALIVVRETKSFGNVSQLPLMVVRQRIAAAAGRVFIPAFFGA